MLDERRALLWSLVGHALAATPFLVATWYLFSSTVGDIANKRLLGLACGVTAGIIIARPIAALIAEPMGSLFFPRAGARPVPGYSLADAQRKRGQFERALIEYEKIAEEFPGEMRAHVAMLEITLINLHDAERARVTLTRGLALVRDEQMRLELVRVHRLLVRRTQAEAHEGQSGGTDAEE